MASVKDFTEYFAAELPMSDDHLDLVAMAQDAFDGLPSRAISVKEFFVHMSNVAQKYVMSSSSAAYLAGAIERKYQNFVAWDAYENQIIQPQVDILNPHTLVDGLPETLQIMTGAGWVTVHNNDLDEADVTETVEELSAWIPPLEYFDSPAALSYDQVIELGQRLVNHVSGEEYNIYSPKYIAFYERHKARLNLIYSTSPGPKPAKQIKVRTLQHTYLLRDSQKRVFESEKALWFRVAVGIISQSLTEEQLVAMDDEAHLLWKDLVYCFDSGLQLKLMHASPTLFNAGLKLNMYSSCFLGEVKDDLIDIMREATDLALNSKYGGGNGHSLSRLRVSGSPIKSTGGQSNGPLMFAKIYEAVLAAVDQGGGKRKGVVTIYLEPWHAWIWQFAAIRSKREPQYVRIHGVTHAIWAPNIFFERAEAGKPWPLFDPKVFREGRHLVDLHGHDFEEELAWLEANNKAMLTVNAKELMMFICQQQVESGGPFILNKDLCNSLSNHRHLGTIVCSNLCTEIIEKCNAGKNAVCNLANIVASAFVKQNVWTVDAERRKALIANPMDNVNWIELEAAIRFLVRSLHRVIDGNFYPTDGAREINNRDRPIAIGVQGLADLFAQLGIPFVSADCTELDSYRGKGKVDRLTAARAADPARALDKVFFASMYYWALDEGLNEAERRGRGYESYPGSPLSEGLLHPDLFFAEDAMAAKPGVHQDQFAQAPWLSWDVLRSKLARSTTGPIGSLFIAMMPTGTTSIIGDQACSETTDPYKAFIMSREVLAGSFTVSPTTFDQALRAEGCTLDAIYTDLAKNAGSLTVDTAMRFGLSDAFTHIFCTVYDIRPPHIVHAVSQRMPYIDQSCSQNMHMRDATPKRVFKMLMDAYKKKLKTLMYYLRTKPAKMPPLLGMDTAEAPTDTIASLPLVAEGAFCTRDNPECLACQ